MIDRAHLIQEIDTIPPVYYREVADFIVYIKERQERKPLSLEQAAQMALEDYCSDSELTVFTELDGEDFYETR